MTLSTTVVIGVPNDSDEKVFRLLSTAQDPIRFDPVDAFQENHFLANQCNRTALYLQHATNTVAVKESEKQSITGYEIMTSIRLSTERLNGYEGLYRVARREYAPLASTSEVTLGPTVTNEANVGEPVLPQSDTGFFVPISNVLHTDGLVAETV